MLTVARTLPGGFSITPEIFINQGFIDLDAGLSRQERETFPPFQFSLLEDAKLYFTNIYKFLSRVSILRIGQFSVARVLPGLKIEQESLVLILRTGFSCLERFWRGEL